MQIKVKVLVVLISKCQVLTTKKKKRERWQMSDLPQPCLKGLWHPGQVTMYEPRELVIKRCNNWGDPGSPLVWSFSLESLWVIFTAQTGVCLQTSTNKKKKSSRPVIIHPLISHFPSLCQRLCIGCTIFHCCFPM